MIRAKADLRKVALAARAEASAAAARVACARLLDEIDGPGPVAGYLPIGTELSPLLAMERLARRVPVCVPEIVAPAMALAFRRWAPGCALAPGPFRTLCPVDAERLEPAVVIVPLVGFDRRGARLGYGGGFYDRTLRALRARPGGVRAIGLAFAAQELPEVPVEPTDEPLDLIVTEAETLRP